jgi:hypothetical protein
MWVCVCEYVFCVCDVQPRLVKINITYRTCAIMDGMSRRRRTLTEESHSRESRDDKEGKATEGKEDEDFL